MLFFCLYKQLNVKKENAIQNTLFSSFQEYNSFITNNSKYIIWAKLIDSETGEVFDTYTNLNYITIGDFNVNINPNELKNFDNSGLCLKREFKNFIEFALKHKDKLNMNSLTIPYVELRKEENEEKFIPEDVLLINKPMVENIIKTLSFSLDEEEMYEFNKFKPKILNLQKT